MTGNRKLIAFGASLVTLLGLGGLSLAGLPPEPVNWLSDSLVWLLGIFAGGNSMERLSDLIPSRRTPPGANPPPLGVLGDK